MAKPVTVTIRKNLLPVAVRGVRREGKRLRGDVAGRIVKYAKGYSPVRTGYNRDHIVKRDDDTVAAEAPYAGYLEFGTRFMRARPFVRPAVERVTGDLHGGFSGAFGDWESRILR